MALVVGAFQRSRATSGIQAAPAHSAKNDGPAKDFGDAGDERNVRIGSERKDPDLLTARLCILSRRRILRRLRTDARCKQQSAVPGGVVDPYRGRACCLRARTSSAGNASSTAMADRPAFRFASKSAPLPSAALAAYAMVVAWGLLVAAIFAVLSFGLASWQKRPA